jgi:hypothetical protein
VEVADRQELGLALGQPVPRRDALALRAVAVAADAMGRWSLVIAVTNAAPVITPAEHPHVQAERPQPILFAL